MNPTYSVAFVDTPKLFGIATVPVTVPIVTTWSRFDAEKFMERFKRSMPDREWRIVVGSLKEKS